MYDTRLIKIIASLDEVAAFDYSIFNTSTNFIDFIVKLDENSKIYELEILL